MQSISDKLALAGRIHGCWPGKSIGTLGLPAECLTRRCLNHNAGECRVFVVA
jgi:hypothetical protein